MVGDHDLVCDAALRRQDSLPVLVFFDVPEQDAYDPKYRDPFCFLNLQAEWRGVGTREMCVFSGNNVEALSVHVACHSREYSRIILFFLAKKLPGNISNILLQMNEQVQCHACRMKGRRFSLLSCAIYRPDVVHG